MKLSGVKGIVQNTSMYNLVNAIVKSLNKIMVVLIVLASLLTVVILFNLTNINVAERIRELSTIKVLGFRDKEVTMYIYKETIILSQIGIIVGWLFGIFLHTYILNVVPPDEVMFDPSIWIGAYIISFVVINVVNIPNTEMASILACKDNGMVYFFSMATSFTKAALGAEGVGKDVTMLIGNGYTKGHANVALQILREDERIRNLFAQLYA